MTDTITCEIVADIEVSLLFAMLDQQCPIDSMMATGTTIRQLLIECEDQDPGILDVLKKKYPYLKDFHFDLDVDESDGLHQVTVKN